VEVVDDETTTKVDEQQLGKNEIVVVETFKKERIRDIALKEKVGSNESIFHWEMVVITQQW
jgi:hypothetical protein